MADLTPLSSRRSFKGTSTDSSHLHLGALETLSLRRSDPLPQKLLAHLAEGGGADLRSLSPYVLRLSGAGFAYYAPGPETSVWTQTKTLKRCVCEARELMRTVHPKMYNWDLHLKDQGFIKQNINQHVHTHQVHHVHFLGYSWVDNPLDIIAMTAHFHTLVTSFCSGGVPVLVSSKFLPKLFVRFTWKSLRTKGEPCAKVHCLMHCGTVSTCQQSGLFVVRVLIFNHILACFSTFVSFSLLCKCLSKNIYVQYVVWPSKGSRQAQPFRCACVCMCVWVLACMNMPVVYVCMYVTHLCLTGNHTAAG